MNCCICEGQVGEPYVGIFGKHICYGCFSLLTKSLLTKPPKANKPSQRPKPEEVAAYAKSIGFTLNGADFVDYYASQGWNKKNGRPLRDWKAGVRTWKKRYENNASPAIKRALKARQRDESLAKCLKIIAAAEDPKAKAEEIESEYGLEVTAEAFRLFEMRKERQKR